MNEIGKIWALDFRRQRAVFLVIIPFAVMLTLMVFYGGLAQKPRELLALAIILLLPIAGYLVSADVWARDFRERTVNFYFALPVADGRLFIARYFSSLAVFALFIWLPLLLIATYGESENGQPVIDFCREALHFTSPRWGRFSNFGLFGPALALLLLVHAMQINWTLGFRGDKGLQAGFLLTPLALLALWPATVWIYSPEFCTMTITNRAAIALLLIATAVFLLGGWWLWTRGVGRGGRTGWMLIKLWSGLVALSLGAWALFYAIEIQSYLVTLDRFEHTPGIDIVRGPQQVPEVIQNYRSGLKLKPEQLAAADFSKTVEIPAAAYPQYMSKLLFFRLALKNAIENALPNRRYELAASLIKRFRETPEIYLPEQSHFYPKFPGRPLDPPTIMDRGMTRFDFVLNSIKFPTEPDALPFYRDLVDIFTIPRPQPEIKIILPRDRQDRSPANCEINFSDHLPGFEATGWKRLATTLEWVLRQGVMEAPFRGSELRNVTETMKHWIKFSEYLQTAKTTPPTRLNELRLEFKKEDLFVFCGNDPVFEAILDLYFLLPYCRLQQYAIEHGSFPRLPPQQMLKPGEPEIFRLYYCTGTVNKHQLHTTLPQDHAQLRFHAQSQYSSHCLPLVKLDAKGTK